MKKQLIFLLILTGISCKKKKNEEVTPTLPIDSIVVIDPSSSAPTKKISLPVKIIRKNASNQVITTSILEYDSQKRLISSKKTDVNPELSETQTYSYETGKITLLIDYTAPSKADTKYIYYYDENGMIKEEVYENNQLSEIITWFNRADGGKERRCKKPDGTLRYTAYYRFDSSGNLMRMAVDTVESNQADYEIVYTSYDNKKRCVTGLYWSFPFILAETGVTKIAFPNNPLQMKRNIINGTIWNYEKYKYQYNSHNQVIQHKILDLQNNNALISENNIEYQEF